MLKQPFQGVVPENSSLRKIDPLREASTPKKQKLAATLTNAEAAVYLGVQPGTLDVWRSVKRYAIPYIKCGRLVKYRQSDLDTWLESRTVGEGNA